MSIAMVSSVAGLAPHSPRRVAGPSAVSAVAATSNHAGSPTALPQRRAPLAAGAGEVPAVPRVTSSTSRIAPGCASRAAPARGPNRQATPLLRSSRRSGPSSAPSVSSATPIRMQSLGRRGSAIHVDGPLSVQNPSKASIGRKHSKDTSQNCTLAMQQHQTLLDTSSETPLADNIVAGAFDATLQTPVGVAEAAESSVAAEAMAAARAHLAIAEEAARTAAAAVASSRGSLDFGLAGEGSVLECSIGSARSTAVVGPNADIMMEPIVAAAEIAATVANAAAAVAEAVARTARSHRTSLQSSRHEHSGSETVPHSGGTIAAALGRQRQVTPESFSSSHTPGVLGKCIDTNDKATSVEVPPADTTCAGNAAVQIANAVQAAAYASAAIAAAVSRGAKTPQEVHQNVTSTVSPPAQTDAPPPPPSSTTAGDGGTGSGSLSTAADSSNQVSPRDSPRGPPVPKTSGIALSLPASYHGGAAAPVPLNAAKPAAIASGLIVQAPVSRTESVVAPTLGIVAVASGARCGGSCSLSSPRDYVSSGAHTSPRDSPLFHYSPSIPSAAKASVATPVPPFTGQTGGSTAMPMARQAAVAMPSPRVATVLTPTMLQTKQSPPFIPRLRLPDHAPIGAAAHSPRPQDVPIVGHLGSPRSVAATAISRDVVSSPRVDMVPAVARSVVVTVASGRDARPSPSCEPVASQMPEQVPHTRTLDDPEGAPVRPAIASPQAVVVPEQRSSSSGQPLVSGTVLVGGTSEVMAGCPLSSRNRNRSEDAYSNAVSQRCSSTPQAIVLSELSQREDTNTQSASELRYEATPEHAERILRASICDVKKAEDARRRSQSGISQASGRGGVDFLQDCEVELRHTVESEVDKVFQRSLRTSSFRSSMSPTVSPRCSVATTLSSGATVMGSSAPHATAHVGSAGAESPQLPGQIIGKLSKNRAARSAVAAVSVS